MSKINQIQNGVKELGGGAFQKLANAYLHSRGYAPIDPLGSVVGSDKARKGTPDALVSLSSGKYVLIEHTTQDKGLFEKLVGDLANCLDEEKTGIPVDEIEEVVFCHTGRLSSADQRALAKKAQAQGVNLEIVGIGCLSHDLYQKYPNLARDFLGVEVDTGQIVSPGEFVAAHARNALATPLDTAFRFREEEVNQVLQGLEEVDLVIISGAAGVGKSRLALECCREFVARHPEYTVYCVFNRYHRDLFDDLQTYCSPPGKYLIFVDDANRVTRFDYFIRILQDQRDDQQIKVIAAVRSYALGKVRDEIEPYGDVSELQIQPLDDDQIMALVEHEYEVRNGLWLERIAHIARGNPRLAIMAAEVAVQDGRLSSIIDVSSIYEEYYSSIRQDLERLGDQSLLEVAGIVTFFLAVDRSNDEMMAAIEAASGISPDAFWQGARRLHGLEIFDMYEDEVVRTSDQVLSSYLFYLAFFRESILDFSNLLEQFFPHLKHRFVDAVYSVLDAFDDRMLTRRIRPAVEEMWKGLEDERNDESLLHLIDVFWFVDPAKTLLHIRDKIAEMEPRAADLSEAAFEPDSRIPSPSLLTILSSFKYSRQENLRVALELLLDYVAKRPDELSRVIHLLTEQFGFTHRSYARGFSIQRSVIEKLWARTREGREELFSRLFLAVAKAYLRVEFRVTEAEGRTTVRMIKFQLPPQPELLELRKTIWNSVFKLYAEPSLRDAVLELLRDYTLSAYQSAVDEIVRNDAVEILSFVESRLAPTKYLDALVVQDFLDLLHSKGIAYDENLRDTFTNGAYGLHRLLLFDRGELGELDREECRNLREERIAQYVGEFTLYDFRRFVAHCLDIQSELGEGHRKSQLKPGIQLALDSLANQHPSLYVEAMAYYLELGNPLALNPIGLVRRLVEIAGVSETHDLLDRYEFPSRRRWLFSSYRSIPPDQITPEHLQQLLELYAEADPGELPYSMDFLVKYGMLGQKAIPRVTAIILDKTEQNLASGQALSDLFNPHTQVGQDVLDHFADDVELLKRAYLVACGADWSTDHDGRTFARILDADPGFLLEYLDWICSEEPYRDRVHPRDYSFLWTRDDYETLILQLLERVYHEQETCAALRLEDLFVLWDGTPEKSAIKDRQDDFLRGLISRRYDDVEFMRWFFSMIADFAPLRRRRLLSYLLEHNTSFAAFSSLPLEPTSWSWSGSAVPLLQERVRYFQSLLPLLSTVELLQHKQFVQRRIQSIRQEIEWEKKRDFIED